MAGRFKSFPYSTVLSAAAVTIAAAMVGLLGFEWTQRQSLQDQANLRVDSVTAPAYLLDREFLRFLHCLEEFLHSRKPPSQEELQLRLDVLNSRVGVLRESPGSIMLLQNQQVAQAVTQLEAYIKRADAALAAPVLDMYELQDLHDSLREFAIESLALGNVADLQGSTLLDQQSHGLLDQNLQITLLTLGLLLLHRGAVAQWRQCHKSCQRRRVCQGQGQRCQAP
jgi:hypothetical protein